MYKMNAYESKKDDRLKKSANLLDSRFMGSNGASMIIFMIGFI